MSNRPVRPEATRAFDSAVLVCKTHANMAKNDSALVCISDALSVWNRGQECDAYKRLLHSLSYSVGIFHDDYRRIKSIVDSYGKR